jgi:hypothetical protein
MTRFRFVIDQIVFFSVQAACSIAFIILALCPRLGHADPKVSLHWIEDDWNDGCEFWGDGLILSITDHGRVILKKHYCSAYGAGEVRMVTDAIGNHYVFLEYSEGHGTSATTGYLKIYRFTNRLIEKDHFTISEFVGPDSVWTCHYIIHTPHGGGLQLILTRTLDGPPDPDIPMPPETQIITIDRPNNASPSMTYIPMPRPNAINAGLQAALYWIGDGGAGECRSENAALLLTIADHGQLILEKHYCSEDGLGNARLVADAIGQHYVFLEYDTDQGATGSITHLKILRFTDQLTEKSELDISYFDGADFLWVYHYNIRTPPGGGLKIFFKLALKGKPPPSTKLPSQTQIIAVDCAE